jgi:glycerol uptake facilitator-like aquaporin
MSPRSTELARQVLAEFLGSMLLAAIVIGSGIAAQRLSPTTSACNCWKTQPPPRSASTP